MPIAFPADSGLRHAYHHHFPLGQLQPVDRFIRHFDQPRNCFPRFEIPELYCETFRTGRIISGEKVFWRNFARHRRKDLCSNVGGLIK